MTNLRRLLRRPATAAAPWMSTLIERYAGGGTFVDVGANVGQTLERWLQAERPGQYLGFEPIPSCAAEVQRIIDARASAARIVPIALTAEPVVSELYVPGGDLTSSTLLSGLRPGRNDQTLIIAGLPFDLAWRSLGRGAAIDFVKVDVEGGELAALTGMRDTLRAQRPPVVCEILRRDPEADASAHGSRSEALMTLLGEVDYQVHRIVKPTGAIEGYERIDALPSDPWTEATSEDNDYLLLPAGQEPARV
jgi:FkbM family methyltransferase